jgi:hypothetical protein
MGYHTDTTGYVPFWMMRTRKKIQTVEIFLLNEI